MGFGGVDHMKKLLLILCIFSVVILILFALFFVFVVSGAFAIFMSNPPVPQITYGEFPFTIVYEVAGETIEYNDVVICEYEGIKSFGTAGKKRTWSRKLKSGNDCIILLQSETNDTSFELYTPIPGLPEYYMGDFQQSRAEYESSMKNTRYLGCVRNGMESRIKAEDAWEQYHIKIISITCSSPIENEFK